MSSVTEFTTPLHRRATQGEPHTGHINGALSTKRHGDIAPRNGWAARLKTLLAILRPGLRVEARDNTGSQGFSDCRGGLILMRLVSPATSGG
jgi:hypothetical protein